MIAVIFILATETNYNLKYFVTLYKINPCCDTRAGSQSHAFHSLINKFETLNYITAKAAVS
jgi:hypothetical protein